MSSIKVNSLRTEETNLVSKILEQGQRLRNSLVETLLNNDPFYTDFTNYNRSAVVSHREFENYPKKTKGFNDKIEQEKLTTYLQGDKMSLNDEKQALDTLRSLSADDVCKIFHNQQYNLNTITCNCSTCKLYNNFNDKQLSDVTVPPLKLPSEKEIENTHNLLEQNSVNITEFLRYVDSLKIAVHSLKLNEAGNRKACASTIDQKYKYPASISHTYFIEYQVPDIIVRPVIKTKAKVDSGLDGSNIVRICSKKLHNEAIYFKQISLHDVVNLDRIKLNDVEVKFQISCRTLKQKSTNILGYAKFNLSNLERNEYLSCNVELPVQLSEDKPIILGSLKLSVHLGCNQLYFDKEFIDAIKSSIEYFSKNQEVEIESPFIQHTNTEVQLATSETIDSNKKEVDNVSETIDYKQVVYGKQRGKVTKASSVVDKTIKMKPIYTVPNSTEQKTIANNNMTTEVTFDDKQILFGFLYVSEAQYIRKSVNSYFTCRPFCQEAIVYSRVVNSSSNPIFNFYQLIPLVYENELLNNLRDNCMILEFLEKKEENKDEVIGIAKLPLHQFYLAYKNPVIVKYLIQNKAPILGTDWWEPITYPCSSDICGQVQVLLALGTLEQIKNLEIERGFKEEHVTARSTSIIEPIKKKQSPSKPAQNSDNSLINTKPNCSTTKSSSTNRSVHFNKHKIEKIDASTQSSIEMDMKTDKQAQDMLSTFLEQLIVQRQKNICVETSTNTESCSNKNEEKIVQDEANNELLNKKTKVELKKTSDLLDSLQKALTVNSKLNFCNNSHRAMSCEDDSENFKAHIVVEEALHLPSRKKCKSKRSKAKNFKQEEILPSAYVTFETIPGIDLKITPVAHKTTSPVWNFRCDVLLPIELLTNNQKRLIFKVWNQSSNSSAQPNYQADVILGFAALDLTVLLAGLPTVQGWFNIVDFSSKCNGQIKINITPLENLSKHRGHAKTNCQQQPVVQKSDPKIEENIEKLDEPSELLSRALKRKFIELDEITQRLRLRLSSVTNDESDALNDDLADEFEHDINTLCVEDDFDTVNFETQLEIDCEPEKPMSSLGLLQIQDPEDDEIINADACSLLSLDKHLIEGKQRIDTLLQKLTLISANENDCGFQNRYVSGCSVNNESESRASADNALKADSEVSSDTDALLNPTLFQQLCAGDSAYSTPINVNTGESSQTASSSSILTTFGDNRSAPDGEGNCTEDKVLKNKQTS